MKKIILFFCFTIISLYGLKVQEKKWPQGETFLTFLQRYSIPKKLYFNLGKEDKELSSEITAGEYFYLAEDEDGSLNQVLIPVSDEIQLHVYKDNKGIYKFETLPISYKEYNELIAIPIKNSVSIDLKKATGSDLLAANLKQIFRGINFKRMQKNDFIVVHYSQKELLGRTFGQPDIKSAMLEVSGKKHYRFKNKKDDKYYDEKGKTHTKIYFLEFLLGTQEFQVPLQKRDGILF